MAAPMPDHRTPDELSLAELEALLEQRRRIERGRRLARLTERPGFRLAAPPSSESAEKKIPAARGRGRLRYRVLLFVELGGALALALVLVAFLTNLDLLNRATLQGLAATPGPNVVWAAEELPASPFRPTSTAKELPGSSFPPEPAPPALGIRLQSVAALPVPTPGPRAATRIVIPAIKIDWPVVEGDDWESLKQGIGHHPGTANPGERGNMVLSGHNDVYGEPFRDLEIIEIGKEVIIYSGANAFRYVIKAKRVVPPTDLSPLQPSRTPIVTLITCTPYRVDTMRLIVTGELVP